MNHVMIDIETLSTSVDALVLSIGAQKFECHGQANGPLIDDGILLVPNLVEQILAGRRIDRDTQQWWQKQDPAAAKHWVEPPKSLTVRSALVELGDYIKGTERIWARGTHFDIAILDGLHQSFGLKSPWKYNSIRDVRTFCDDRTKERVLPCQLLDLVPHHPLHDCRVQIVDLWEHGLS